jgi:hypothetical protein
VCVISCKNILCTSIEQVEKVRIRKKEINKLIKVDPVINKRLVMQRSRGMHVIALDINIKGYQPVGLVTDTQLKDVQQMLKGDVRSFFFM